MKLIEPRTLKGFKDYLPSEQIARSRMIKKIIAAYELYGFEPLETPALEYEDILAGKYGDEGEQLMYRFRDNGERDVAMRYDLTIPLARVVAQHGADLPRPFKRYQVAPVWRGENTQKGRLREFMQCDADIVGAEVGIADAECIALAESALLALGLKKFVIKVNNRKILNAIMRTAGVPEEKIIDAIRIIDKIEKIGAQGVSAELQEKLGMTVNEAEGLIRLSSTKAPDVGALKTFMSKYILRDPQGTEGFTELNAVFSALEHLGVKHAEIDLSLARGLDYYTSTVYEVVLTHAPDAKRFGSIAAGGRYDRLINLFTGKDMPAVGVSIGLDRLFAGMQEMELASEEGIAKVLILNFDEKYDADYLGLLHELRSAGIPSEMYYAAKSGKADFKKQYAYAESKSIPYAVLVGEDEAKAGTATIRNLATRKQEVIKRGAVVSYFAEALQKK